MSTNACGPTVVIRPPGQPPEEIPIEDLLPDEQIFYETTRKTKQVSVSGVIIDRIEEVSFEDEGGRKLTLVFKN